MSKTNSELKPTLTPPDHSLSKIMISGKTTPMDNSASALISNKKATNGSGSQHAAPLKTPPSVSKSGEITEASLTTWSNAATINALWCINQDKNSWMGDAALGWKKLSYASESGIVALTMLCSHAKQMQSAVYYRTEDDAMVHEIYVW